MILIHTVSYFFNEYIISVRNVLNEILEEASRDLGLFILQNTSKEIFLEKVKMRNDERATKFIEWYVMRLEKEHEGLYPNFIQKVCEFQNKFRRLPKIKIIISASDRYEDDINQQIKVNLSHKRLRSREE